MTLLMTTLLDTSRPNDALACGYDTTPPASDALRIVLEQHPQVGPCVYLYGPDGEVSLIGRAEIAEVYRALRDVVEG